jgi:hypothetical protein
VSADRWGDDWTGDPELPRHLAELRDGIAPPQPNRGQARARRLEQMQHDIAQCADVTADLDRWLDGQPCVGQLVPKLIRAYAEQLRRDADTKRHALFADLHYLRARS